MEEEQFPEGVGPTEYWLRANEFIAAGLLDLHACWGLAGLDPKTGKAWPNERRSKTWAWGSHLMKLEKAAMDAARFKGLPYPVPGTKASRVPQEAPKSAPEDDLEGPWDVVAGRYGIRSIAALHLFKLLSRRPHTLDDLKHALGHVTQDAIAELTGLGLAEYSHKTGEVKRVRTTPKA